MRKANLLRRLLRQAFGDDKDDLAATQQDITEERADPDADYFRNALRKGSSLRIHVREFELETIYKIIVSNHRCHPGTIFLAEHKKTWMEGKAQVDFPLMFGEFKLSCFPI